MSHQHYEELLAYVDGKILSCMAATTDRVPASLFSITSRIGNIALIDQCLIELEGVLVSNNLPVPDTEDIRELKGDAQGLLEDIKREHRLHMRNHHNKTLAAVQEGADEMAGSGGSE